MSRVTGHQTFSSTKIALFRETKVSTLQNYKKDKTKYDNAKIPVS